MTSSFLCRLGSRAEDGAEPVPVATEPFGTSGVADRLRAGTVLALLAGRQLSGAGSLLTHALLSRSYTPTLGTSTSMSWSVAADALGGGGAGTAELRPGVPGSGSPATLTSGLGGGGLAIAAGPVGGVLAGGARTAGGALAGGA